MTMSVRSWWAVIMTRNDFPLRRVFLPHPALGSPGEQLANIRQCEAHGLGARGMGFLNAREIIPIDLLNFGFEDHVCMPGPRECQLLIVRSLQIPTEHLNDVAG